MGMQQMYLSQKEQDLLRTLIAAQVAVIEGEFNALTIILARATRLSDELKIERREG